MGKFFGDSRARQLLSNGGDDQNKTRLSSAPRAKRDNSIHAQKEFSIRDIRTTRG